VGEGEEEEESAEKEIDFSIKKRMTTGGAKEEQSDG
jgi:hypothetical protein